MGVALVGPNRPMGIGAGRIALWCPLAQDISPLPGQPPATNPGAIGTLTGWWDASIFQGGLTGSGAPAASWNIAVASIADKSSRALPLLPFSRSGAPAPVITARLSGFLGGVGHPVFAPSADYPDLHPDLGFQIQGDVFPAGQNWTLYLVWSRPNWRQDSGKDSLPVTLLSIRGTPILQVDSAGGEGCLKLVTGNQSVQLASSLSRRHTHSVVVRYMYQRGFDIWFDSDQVAAAVSCALPSSEAPSLLLHDGSMMGAAQCWFHEAATWSEALCDADMSALLAYASRWMRGSRRGLVLLLNGQSNAINYALQDGAATLLAQGVSWYTGCLAYKVLATTGNPSSYTMQSGHGIYPAVNRTYPGSFLNDPGDGSNPAAWQLGADGNAVVKAIAQLSTEDRLDICALVWPWNETDSLRNYQEQATFGAAARRFLSLERAVLGATPDRLPLIWWNAIPYGISGGIQMHREVVAGMAADTDQNVWIGNPQTSDSNPRGSSWDPTTGTSTGGDSAHRDSLDNQRFARLAAPIVAAAVMRAGRADAMTSMPPGIPLRGGPFIEHAYKESPTTIILTVQHDAGTDVKVPLLAASGTGFAVMDGGTPGSPGAVIQAVSCTRLDATHLQLTLAHAMTNASSACHLYYPYGSASIGRGNVVTDNYSERPKPVGWDIAADLGVAWSLDFPLAATTTPIVLSDTAQ